MDVTSTLRYDAETALGTGFIVDGRAGLVLTNNHVVRDATSVTVTLTDTGRTYPARIVGTDPGADVAVLQVEGASGLTAAPIGDSAAVTVGAPVLAIGNQAGRDGPPAARAGVVESLSRTIQAADGTSGFTETLHGMLQTSAQIELGDSGRPAGGLGGNGNRHGHRRRHGDAAGRVRDPHRRCDGRRTPDRRRAIRPRDRPRHQRLPRGRRPVERRHEPRVAGTARTRQPNGRWRLATVPWLRRHGGRGQSARGDGTRSFGGAGGRSARAGQAPRRRGSRRAT